MTPGILTAFGDNGQSTSFKEARGSVMDFSLPRERGVRGFADAERMRRSEGERPRIKTGTKPVLTVRPPLPSFP